MDIGIFTYIAGFATVIALILQIKDSFPAHREVRKAIFYISLGAFIGVILGSLQSATINMGFEISGFSLLVGAILLIMGILIIGAITANDTQKRSHLLEASGIGVLALIFVLLFGGMMTMGNPYREKEKLTIDELVIVAEKQISNKNYDRAIFAYETIKNRLGSKDERVLIIKDKISAIKQLQLNEK
ncbi:MAG: hypothetical protein BA863_05540 [Desulfovibrio sp. S3730MH75]|nr:MAG: hypothetical protein BA863_05540 [Desulfovibrio sp. S3730MH75]